MKIDGVSFNQTWSWGKTEAEFVTEFKDMEHIYPDVADKTVKLKEVYALLQKDKPKDYVAPKRPVVVAPTDVIREGLPMQQHLPESAKTEAPALTATAAPAALAQGATDKK